jgi:hypothetical protein
MSIEELLEALERYVRESAEGDREVAIAQHSCPNPAPSGRIPGREDLERGEITRRPELDREQCPTRLQARQYGWSYADQLAPK